MLGNSGPYANKKRKKPVLKPKKESECNEPVKSNPSKRHRDRLNGELDRLTELLPYAEDVRSRLDKLSVLRLSVGYLRVKSYFKASMKYCSSSSNSSSSSSSSLIIPGLNGLNGNNMDTAGFSEGDMLLQALNGFVLVVTSEGLVFYASPTIKEYLGFHQLDVVHQSVFDLIHTEDRDVFRQQLHFALNPTPVTSIGSVLQNCVNSEMYNPEQLPPENSSFLERSFVCRFRCLLDNSSGFLALRFQGRLKYLHGQTIMRDNTMVTTPQLALFTIAMPVQSPSIVEIRAKALLFQTKHKLDFTPMGVDSRGKVILGYSEIELCMKGSGYQFIHAADMMYCADNHIRMIKTGESGLTVFRLLSKSNGWVWVKSNAKLIYKDGRPEFIIAYQKALVNSEGEEYLRQRRLQLPFSHTTGEAILYNTGPTVDIDLFQFNKMFNTADTNEDVSPGSMLGCFLQQDESIYTQKVDAPLPVDKVFMDSRALLSVTSNGWQDSSVVPASPISVVKDEAKQGVRAVIDNFDKLSQNSDLCTALQNLEVDQAELMEWENTLKRLGQSEEQQSNVGSDLDAILTNDIFDYIDRVLFQEKEDEGVEAKRPNNNPQSPPLEPQLFKTQSPDPVYSPKNGIYAHQQRPDLLDSAFGGAQRLSHQGPLVAPAGSSLPQLQLPDIFSATIELPELVVPATTPQFPPCGQVGGAQGLPAQSSQLLPGALQAPVGAMDILPPLIPCNALRNSTAPTNIPVPFSAAPLQGNAPFEAHRVQQWPQKLSHAGVVPNGHEPVAHAFPHAGPWPRRVNGLNHVQQQGGLACGQASTQNSCMYAQHFPSGPALGDMLSQGLRQTEAAPDPSSVQSSCCFPTGGNQENGNLMAAPEHALNVQHYQENHRQTQDERLPAELRGIFSAPPLDVAMYLTE